MCSCLEEAGFSTLEEELLCEEEVGFSTLEEAAEEAGFSSLEEAGLSSLEEADVSSLEEAGLSSLEDALELLDDAPLTESSSLLLVTVQSL